MTKNELYEKIRDTLIEDFEIDAAAIKPEAKLFMELGLDSIDAVDLIVKMKPYVQGTIEPAQFKEARTVEDVVNILYPLLKE
jgi:acyl carrier protein